MIFPCKWFSGSESNADQRKGPGKSGAVPREATISKRYVQAAAEKFKSM